MSNQFVCIETQITELKKVMDKMNADKYRLEGAIGILEDLKGMGVARIDLNKLRNGTHYHHISNLEQIEEEDTKTQE